MNAPTGRKARVRVRDRAISASLRWNSRAIAVSVITTTKKSNASSVQPRNPAKTAARWSELAGAWAGEGGVGGWGGWTVIGAPIMAPLWRRRDLDPERRAVLLQTSTTHEPIFGRLYAPRSLFPDSAAACRAPRRACPRPSPGDGKRHPPDGRALSRLGAGRGPATLARRDAGRLHAPLREQARG